MSQITSDTSCPPACTTFFSIFTPMVVRYWSSKIVETNRRIRLDFPTEKDPSMQIFFCNGTGAALLFARGCAGVGALRGNGGLWSEVEFERDAAIEMPVFVRGFRAQRLRNSRAHRSDARRMNAFVRKHLANGI